METARTPMPAAEAARLNSVMRAIQKRFVVEALAEALQPSSTNTLDTLVESVAAHCRANGATFSDALVRELIIEVAEQMGYEGPTD